VLLLSLVTGCTPAPPQRPSGILITLDTTNPGALDVYGKDRALTPHLAALAAESVVFENARTVTPLTLPAHASMLTGLYPLRHGVRDNGIAPLPERADTLAELASSAGYRTGAFVSAHVLASDFGLDQGFDTYDEPADAVTRTIDYMVERRADDVTGAAQRWLSDLPGDEPFFLWVHYFDPHAPYEPPEEQLAAAQGNAYLGEVAWMDKELGNLLALLRGEFDLDDTLVLVCADHGESLGRHGEETHSVLCYDATMRVPMIVRFPGGEHGGTRRTDTVSVVDVFSTFVEELGLPAASDVDGRGLREPAARTRGVYIESYNGYLNYGWSPLAGFVDADAKYLHGPDPELFDLASDPREAHNLLAAPGSASARRAERYTRALELLASRERLPVSETDLDPALLEGIQALGYVGVGDLEGEWPEPLHDLTLPAPRTRLAELAACYAACLASMQGKDAEAMSTLEQVIAANPGNVFAELTLAGLYLDADRPADARARLEQIDPRFADRFTFHERLGRAAAALGEHATAAAAFELALGKQPSDARTRSAAVRAHRAAGDSARADALERGEL